MNINGGGEAGGGGGDLLDIHPSTGELKFRFELKKQSSCSVQLTNKTWDEYVAFKVQTTHPKKYCVKPNTGILLPKKTCSITITMQAQKEAPLDMLSKDKFLLRSVAVPYGATSKDVTPEMFNKEAGMVVEDFKWRVMYVIPSDDLPPAPPPMRPVPANPPPPLPLPQDVMNKVMMICQICDMNSHIGDSCPFLYTPCKVPNCSGIRKLYISKIENNPPKKFLKCHYNQCMGFQLLGDAISEANGSISSSTLHQQQVCFQCGDTTHSSNECPLVLLPSPSSKPTNKQLMKTSNKKETGGSSKCLTCFSTRKHRT